MRPQVDSTASVRDPHARKLSMHGAFEAVSGLLRGQGFGVRMQAGRCQIYLRGADTVLAEGESWDEAVGELLTAQGQR